MTSAVIERRIVLPYSPRRAFMPLHNRSTRWAVAVAHRRAGKTVSCINEIIKSALIEDKPNARFGYLAPFLNQAKSVAWDYLLQFSEPVRIDSNATELSVTLINGAKIRLFGADNPDAMRGLYFDGIVLDEVADMKERVWGEIIRPALADRRGWAIFIGTPKGHNAFYETWQQAQLNADWTTLMIKASESGILPESELADARSGMTPDQYRQEFECSFEAAITGAIYANQMAEALDSGRIGNVPMDPHLRVDTWWDLGVGDATSIIFSQTEPGGAVRIIDYYEASGEGLPHYADVLRKRGYAYRSHNAPHDIAVRELGTGKSRLETARTLGIDYQIVENLPLEDGINALRLLLPKVWFDRGRCQQLIESLQQYRWAYDERSGVMRSRPVHDWTSHAADAARYMAVGHGRITEDERPKVRIRPIFVSDASGY